MKPTTVLPLALLTLVAVGISSARAQETLDTVECIDGAEKEIEYGVDVVSFFECLRNHGQQYFPSLRSFLILTRCLYHNE